MTNPERALATTHDALALVQQILLSLTSRRGEMSPFEFAVQAEGAVDMIRDLRGQIDAQIGMAAADAAVAEMNARIPFHPPTGSHARPGEPVATAS